MINLSLSLYIFPLISFDMQLKKFNIASLVSKIFNNSFWSVLFKIGALFNNVKNKYLASLSYLDVFIRI